MMVQPTRSFFLPSAGLLMLLVFFCELMVMTAALASAAGQGPSHLAVLSQEQCIQFRAMAKDVPACEEVVNGTNGRITSPNYPKEYPDNAACAWDIIVPEGNIVSLRFTDFHIQPSHNCTADYVGVYDGENYFLYCGWQAPPEIRSQANIMGIVLVSDDQVHIGSRFQADFQAVPINTEELCSESVTATVTSDYDHGFMYSPGYPNSYPANADEDCDRVMFTAAGKLRVGFLQLRTRPEDTITVSSRDSSSILLSGKLDYTNEFPKLLSDSSNIRIRMNSDGSGTDAGYLVAYAGALDGVRCARITKKSSKTISTSDKPTDIIHISLTDETVYVDSSTKRLEPSRLVENVAGKKYGFIMSPNHPHVYPDDVNIMFNITTSDAGSRVALRFLRLDLEHGFDEIMISQPGQGDLLVKDLPTDVIYSEGSEVYITFRTDVSVHCTGFLLAYSSIEP